MPWVGNIDSTTTFSATEQLVGDPPTGDIWDMLSLCNRISSLRIWNILNDRSVSNLQDLGFLMLLGYIQE